MTPTVTWHTPSPFWREALKDSSTGRFKRPELLRFDQDTFMEDLQSTLDANPNSMLSYVAQFETWRDQRVGWVPETGNPDDITFDPAQHIPLYQPAHQRFYLVGASLVCQVRGLPDKQVDAAAEEATSFVIRRRVPTTGSAYDEYGWFGDLGWKRIPNPKRVDTTEADGTFFKEERLPLFPVSFGSNGKRRRLLMGFVPVASRELYETAPSEGAIAPPAQELQNDDLNDPRTELFNNVMAGFETLRDPANADTNDQISQSDAQDVFAFAIYDLSEFLRSYVPNVYDAITQTDSSLIDTTEEQAIFDTLEDPLSTIGDPHAWNDWHDAIRNVADETFLEVLLEGPRISSAERPLVSDSWTRHNIRDAIDSLLATSIRTDIANFNDDTDIPERESIIGAPADVDPAAGSIYHARCVYERPTCQTYRLQPVVSRPTQPFRLASFFDPDAPVRPVRVALPVDTSIAGLRKFPKNVSFLISNELRKQASRVDGVDFEAVSDGDLNPGNGFDLGMICSLSIPIITICALILLLIIVSLLNIVFWWIPFFKICFPLNLKSN